MAWLKASELTLPGARATVRYRGRVWPERHFDAVLDGIKLWLRT